MFFLYVLCIFIILGVWLKDIFFCVEVNKTVNEGMREREARDEVIKIAKKLNLTKILVSPHRKFIKKTVFNKINEHFEGKKYEFFLFNDGILYKINFS